MLAEAAGFLMAIAIRGPYEISALTYYEAGFSPIPAMGKLLVVKRASGRYPILDLETIKRWARSYGPMNVALRLPQNVLALDVDAYKGDLQRLSELEKQLGTLPPTWNSDSRGGKGGKLLYKIPEGLSSQKWLSNINGITIVQHTHRYVMAFPSYNKESDSRYLWYYGIGGNLIEGQQVPSVEDLTELPEKWAVALRKAEVVIFNQTEVYNVGLEDFNDDSPCQYMSVLTQMCNEEVISAYDSGLHDTGYRMIGRIVRAASIGHAGITEALEELSHTFCSAPRTRDLGAEWNNMLPYILAQTEITSTKDICNLTLVLTEQEMRRRIDLDSEMGELLDVGFSDSQAVRMNDLSPKSRDEAAIRMGKTK